MVVRGDSMRESKRLEGVEEVWGFVVFLKEFIALYYWYIELFTRKILNIHAWITSCPDGITPNSGLTGPKKKIYIYIYIYI